MITQLIPESRAGDHIFGVRGYSTEDERETDIADLKARGITFFVRYLETDLAARFAVLYRQP